MTTADNNIRAMREAIKAAGDEYDAGAAELRGVISRGESVLLYIEINSKGTEGQAEASDLTSDRWCGFLDAWSDARPADHDAHAKALGYGAYSQLKNGGK